MNTLKVGQNWNEVEMSNESTITGENKLFDKWFSRFFGMVAGSVIFVTGTSGAGKTTLMVNIMNWYKEVTSYMYSREMDAKSIRQQVNDLVKHNKAFVSDIKDCSNFELFMQNLDVIKPKIIIVDSLQCIAEEDYPEMTLDSACKEIRKKLSKWTQDNNAVCFILGHNTKDGEFAGQNTNMQMVDAHMVLEASVNKDGSKTRRMFWGQKNRKGVDGDLFYEIEDGSITLFSPEEYKHKLGKDSNVTFLDSLKLLIKAYESLDKNHLKYEEYKQEISKLKSACKKRANGSEIMYLTDMVMQLDAINKKYN